MTSSQGNASDPWHRLAPDYERARAREDSLDTLVEWPAQREMLGSVEGLRILDLGCGSGVKLAELVRDGAAEGIGIDLGGAFIEEPPPGLTLIQADFNDFHTLPDVVEKKFDRILFLQSFGYAQDPVGILAKARSMLTDDGFILLTRTQPLRYALERADENGTLVGDEYFSTEMFSTVSGWNSDVTLTKQRYTMSSLLNTFAQAGLWIESASEPHLSKEQAERFPHKHERAFKHLVGILVFKLRTLPVEPEPVEGLIPRGA
ncbi:MAG: class I SAM-dependent methyltransferase [Microbacterium sp.]